MITYSAERRPCAFLERVDAEQDRQEHLHRLAAEQIDWAKMHKGMQDNNMKTKFRDFVGKFLDKAIPTIGSTSNGISDEDSFVQQRLAELESTDLKRVSQRDHVVSKNFCMEKRLALSDSEAEWLGLMAEFFFKHLLSEVLRFFLQDVETTLDCMYSSTNYHKDKDFIFKHLFFHACDSARKDDPAKYLELNKSLRACAPATRYKGYELRRLLAEGIVTIDQQKASPPSPAPSSAPSSAPNSSSSVKSPSSASFINDPFQGIVAPSLTTMDLSYGVPSMHVPGYTAPLADDVASIAKRFLGDFFENKTEKRNKLLAEAKQVRRVYDDVNDARQVLVDMRQSLFDI